MAPHSGRKLLLPAISIWLVVGCLPPHGLGPAPLRIDDGLIQTSFQYGYDANCHVFQTLAEYVAPVSRWFSLAAGGIYTRISDPEFFAAITEPGDKFFADRSFDRSGIPYLKPIIRLGPITIAVPLSGLAIPASKRGGWYGLGGGTIGYSGHRWSVHAGGMYHLLHLYSEGGELDSSTWQASVGGRYDADLDGGLLGLSIEVVYGEHTYQADFNDLSTGLVSNELIMVLGGLNLGWPIDVD